MPTFSFNLHVILPIVIGTEPLRSAYTNTTLPSIGFTDVEAVNIADNQYTMRQTQFAPMYSMVQMPPVGQFESQPPPTLQERIHSHIDIILHIHVTLLFKSNSAFQTPYDLFVNCNSGISFFGLVLEYFQFV